MALAKWKINYYKKSTGRCPTREFLDSLEKQDLVFINRALDRLKEFGPQLERPHIAPLGREIWELRIRTNHGLYRLLFFFHRQQVIIVTHGFQKKTQKVPPEEINRAVEYRLDFLSRKSEDHDGI